MVEVEYERQTVLGVVFRAQVPMLEGAVGAGARPWIQNPANQIVVIVFLADARKIRRKISAHQVRALTDGVARLAAALLKEFLAVGRVSGSLLRQRRPSDSVLPNVGSNVLNFVILQAELRHHCGGAPLVRVLQPI